MGDEAFGRMVDGIGPRRVVVLSDRYPPDTAGGAEVSLHLLLREAPLREQTLVVTFDKSIGCPVSRSIDGVEVLALPANAAWPLHRLSQDQVERIKRQPFTLKWTAFLKEAAACGVRAPRIHAPALAFRLHGGRIRGGVRMAHATVPEGRVQAELRTILDRVRPRLVHADNARSIMMAADVLKERHVPFVALVRDHRFTSFSFDQTSAPLDPSAPTFTERLSGTCAEAALAFRQACLASAAIVVVTSAHLAASLSGMMPQRQLRRLPLEPVEIAPSGPAAPREDFAILIVGSLTEKKGQARLLEAWPEIVRRIPNAVIHIAGQGESQPEIEAIVARQGAGSRVRLHGHLTGEALARLYAGCDVVALPTLWSEPFGRVPLEAGAAGKPVVAYGSGGLVETVLDGITGRVVPPGDIESFAQALAELAADPQERVRMGEAGRTRVAEAFAPDRLARMLADVWDEAIAGAPQARAG